jgi:predicted nucleotidyltransferase
MGRQAESDEETRMLDLSVIDLYLLGEALEDNSYDHKWYVDRVSGKVLLVTEEDLDEDGETDNPNIVFIDSIGSDESYHDMEDFSASVRDPRARDLLLRAIQGRGAFRRFKDTLFDFPDLSKAWFAYHESCLERRAIEWLAAEEIIDENQAEKALAHITAPELPEISGPFEPHEIAKAVAADLKNLYGQRVRKVVLFGSWARGDAHPESDIDLLVVLDRIESWIEERDRMDDVLWRHSVENSTLVSALIVSEDDYELQREPVLVRAAMEGIAVK